MSTAPPLTSSDSCRTGGRHLDPLPADAGPPAIHNGLKASFRAVLPFLFLGASLAAVVSVAGEVRRLPPILSEVPSASYPESTAATTEHGDAGDARLCQAVIADGEPWSPPEPTESSTPGESLNVQPMPDRCECDDDTVVFEWLPLGLLWKPPMANPREPRMAFKFNQAGGKMGVDTAIGAEFGLARVGPADRPEDGLQLDFFAVVFTRFAWSLNLSGADYRAGLPLTYAFGPWQMKLAYEHSEYHLGDEYMLLGWNAGVLTERQVPQNVRREEAVLGLSRTFWDAVRCYGQVGYSFAESDFLTDKSPVRFDWGLEWSPSSFGKFAGGPFAAFDMDLRAEQDFAPGITCQVGWQWQTNERRRTACRFGVEYYDGRTPYGQFYDQRESCWSLIGMYDW